LLSFIAGENVRNLRILFGIAHFYDGGLISLWLSKENNKLRDLKKNMYLLYIFPLLSSTNL
jgi:hypothetical protein